MRLLCRDLENAVFLGQAPESNRAASKGAMLWPSRRHTTNELVFRGLCYLADQRLVLHIAGRAPGPVPPPPPGAPPRPQRPPPQVPYFWYPYMLHGCSQGLVPGAQRSPHICIEAAEWPLSTPVKETHEFHDSYLLHQQNIHAIASYCFRTASSGTTSGSGESCVLAICACR